MNRGKYIVVEGAQGVGKTTMVQMVAKELQAAGLAVRIMREPDSQNDLTARAIRRLTQDPTYPMSTRTEVLLYNAARSQSLEVIRQAVEQGVICLVDRNYLTTLAIQYYGRGDVQDYQRINEIIEFAVGDMQPDLTVVLDAPVTVLRERTTQRYLNERFDNLDEAFLERVRAGYLWEAKQRNLPLVYANEPPETVFKQVWSHVTQTLANRERGKLNTDVQSVGQVLAENPPAAAIEPPILAATQPQTATVASDEPLLTKDGERYTITDAGRQWLKTAVTNLDDNVYATLTRLESVTAAAAMARLSRRGDDLRITLLDEFAGEPEKDAKLLQRVITSYGDDSVQQLVGHHFVVEGASIILTKKLEWGRLAAYLEQSSRYIYFDQKDANGHYRYYVPTELKGKLRSQYIRTMNQIFDLYSGMVKELTDYVRKTSSTPAAEQDAAWRSATKAQACDAVRDVLPLATKTTVGIFASGQAFESLVMHLLSDDLPEAQATGQALLREGRKVIPVFLERADKPDRGGAQIAYRANTHKRMQAVADQVLPRSHAAGNVPVTLVSYTPHNELDIVADMLYEYSDLPLEALQAEVAAWPYDRKLEVFTTYIGERLNRRHRPGRALEKIHYSFDLVAKYGSFKDLQRHRMVDDLGWQAFTPRLGYDVPKLIETAGLTDQYEQCFDLSLQLFSALQAGAGQLTAQYATLHGHNVRWKVTINAREAFQMLELRSSPQGHPDYRRIVRLMHEKIAEVHPLIAEAMTFMNQGEDPELSRLAAERYTQYKLEQLDSGKPAA